MATVVQGHIIPLTAVTYDEFGVPTDADSIVVDILDPAGVSVVTNAVPTEAGEGQYEYEYSVPTDAEVSPLWKARWDAVVNGDAIGPIEEFFEVLSAGSIVPWIDLGVAKALVNDNTLTDADLIFAAQEIYDEMRWTPQHGTDLVTESYSGDLLKADALGRAIAWQASYRQSTTPTPTDGQSVLITSESFDAYAVSYGGQTGKSGIRSGGMIAERALKILRQFGLYNMSGISNSHPRYRYLVANAADVLSDP